MKRLKFERDRRGWSQADVVSRVPGLTVPLVVLIEKGRALPTPEQLEALGRAFRINPASVLLRDVVVREPEEEAVQA